MGLKVGTQRAYFPPMGRGKTECFHGSRIKKERPRKQENVQETENWAGEKAATPPAYACLEHA